jgi:hypothetical protein
MLFASATRPPAARVRRQARQNLPNSRDRRQIAATRWYFLSVADPVYALIFIGLALALLVATLMPAPRHPTEEDAGLGLTLLAAGCVAALAMGVLALAALPVASAVLGAIAWLLVMPCIWLARGPRPLDEWGDEEPEDDDGGSPSPDAPPAPPAPDDRLPGRQPAAAPAARATWTPAPQPAPVMATAARVRQLLAEQETERRLAAQQTERLLAEQRVARVRASTPPAAPPAASPAPPAAAPDVAVTLAAPGAPRHRPAPPRLRPAPRVRAEHGSIVDALAAAAHARTRRRAAEDMARRRAPTSHR